MTYRNAGGLIGAYLDEADMAHFQALQAATGKSNSDLLRSLIRQAAANLSQASTNGELAPNIYRDSGGKNAG